MTHEALQRIQTTKDNAAAVLAETLLSRLQTHLDACAKNGDVQPFTMAITSTVPDDVVAKALETCAVWTDQHGNSQTRNYVWMDSGNPDFLHQVQALATVGVVGGAALAVGAALSFALPVIGAVLFLEVADALSHDAPQTTRYVAFVPSGLRARLRLPVRVFNIASGRVTTTVYSLGAVVSETTGTVKTATQGRLTALYDSVSSWFRRP